jgi:hypothetical protein
MFRSALAPFGVLQDESYARRVFRLRVEGQPIGDTAPRLRKAYSNMYSRDENESLSVARMLVQLDMDSAAENISERDKPDRKVTFTSSGPLYIECSLVESGQLEFTAFLEDANHEVETRRNRDKQLANILKRYNVIIRVAPRVVEMKMRNLVGDVTRFINAGPAVLERVDTVDPSYQVLNACHGEGYWRHKGYESNTWLQKQGEWIDPTYVGPAVARALSDKRAAAAGYDTSCKPLWLLLAIADERLFPPGVEADVRAALAGEAIDPFDKVVITYSGMAPVIVDRSRPPT